MNKLDYRKAAIILILVLAAVVSLLVLTPKMTQPEQYTEKMEYLDGKIANVMELAAGSTAASVVVSAIPGDTATPIAEKLADFSSYFLLILCALYMEKFLLVIVGYLSFQILIPLGCIALIGAFFWQPQMLRRLAVKAFILSAAVLIVIPVSINLSRIIETTFQVSAEDFVERTEEQTEDIKSVVEDEDNASILEKAKSTIDSLTGLAGDCIAQAKELLTEFVNSLAVMIVTSCLIPILVLLFFLGLAKGVLGVQQNSAPMALPGKHPLP